MTRTWIEPIYDRNYYDLQDVQYNPDQTNPKGCWNAVDLNRIEKNTAYCAEWMLEQRIVRTAPSITVRENDYWTANVLPTKSEIDRIINNVKLLIELSSTNPAIANQLPTIYAATQPNYVLANQIEYALDLMHNQPKLPLEYFRVSLIHGIITSVVRTGGTIEVVNSNEALVAEDEVVTIQGVTYGEDAQYQLFRDWSGQTEDVVLLTHYDQSPTTFTMPYGRNIEFTANFETHIPRTLSIVNGYISTSGSPSAETGPSTGTYYAGDQIMIIANIAASGKAFYEWTGTQAGLDNIRGVTEAEDPSTCILTMPDCDVNLAPQYINAGQHSVTVNRGSGGGWYNYKDNVSIYADVPSHYMFSHWSGSTSYLSDIYSSFQSFTMGDENISFTANFTYMYSYNSVQMIDGLIRVGGSDLAQASNLREDTSYTLVPTPSDDTQGIDNWSIEGQGRIDTDYLGNQTNTFIVGDGNAIITGHYAPLRTLTTLNVNNGGNTSTSRIVQGRRVSVDTNDIAGDYMFLNWTENGTVKSTSTRYDFNMPTNDVTLTANYRLKNQVNITINYGTHTETITMQERSMRSITADAAPEGKHFARWTSSGLYRIANANSSTAVITAGEGDGSVTAVYEDDDTRPSHTLTVNNGSGSGSIKEGDGQVIDGDQAPATYEFDYWEIVSGNGTIDNIYAKRTTFRMNTTDAEITAHYKPIPRFTVTMVDGYVQNDSNNWVESASLLRNSTNSIKMKPAPTGYQFLQWEVYENGVLQTNADDVYETFAEATRLRNLLREITIKAVYYVPSPEVKYTLTIVRKDGTTEQNSYSAGTNINVYASSPDTGYEFYKWTGDTAYMAGGIYNSSTYVHMPAQNISIQENYVPEGYIPVYDLVMTNIYGECCYTTEHEDSETHEIVTTDHWVTRWSYPEGTTVRIRTTAIPNEYRFDTWNAINHTTEADARAIISNLSLAQTTLTMPDYDVDAEPSIALKTTYQLRINDGGTSGYYYEGARADVYFNKTNTNDVHYQFLRWTGTTVSQIELYDGGMFNVLTPGTSAVPQYIKMPGQNTEITATYKTLYRLTLTNGTIDSTSATEGFFEAGTIAITANTAPTGMRFQYWTGDIAGVANRFDPTTTVTITNNAVSLTAVYSTDAERNDIGYVTTSLKSTNTVNNNDITIISGQIEIGFIIIDSNGHIYIITAVDTQNNTSTIYRMTKIVQGGNVYG